MAKVKVETRRPIRIAHIEHAGDYGAIPFDRYIERLYGWAKERKTRPGFYPMGIFHDPPADTPPAKCRSEIGIPITGDARGSRGIKTKDLPEMKVAAVSFKGPSSEYRKTYDMLSAWVAENGYAWAGPSIEVYTKKPEQVGGTTIMYAKIEAPIRKKRVAVAGAGS